MESPVRRGSSFVRRLALFILPAAMLICLPAADAGAMTREDVLAVASRYARHAWTCSSGNSHRLYNDLRSGKRYRGVSYNMGGSIPWMISSEKPGEVPLPEIQKDDADGVFASAGILQAWTVRDSCPGVLEYPGIPRGPCPRFPRWFAEWTWSREIY